MGNLGRIGAQYEVPVDVWEEEVIDYGPDTIIPGYTDELGNVIPEQVIPGEPVGSHIEQRSRVRRGQMREEVKAALGSRLTVPTDIPEGEHPLNYALKQNNSSPQIMFFDEPPATWVPVEVTP